MGYSKFILAISWAVAIGTLFYASLSSIKPCITPVGDLCSNVSALLYPDVNRREPIVHLEFICGLEFDGKLSVRLSNQEHTSLCTGLVGEAKESTFILSEIQPDIFPRDRSTDDISIGWATLQSDIALNDSFYSTPSIEEGLDMLSSKMELTSINSLYSVFVIACSGSDSVRYADSNPSLSSESSANMHQYNVNIHVSDKGYMWFCINIPEKVESAGSKFSLETVTTSQILGSSLLRDITTSIWGIMASLFPEDPYIVLSDVRRGRNREDETSPSSLMRLFQSGLTYMDKYAESKLQNKSSSSGKSTKISPTNEKKAEYARSLEMVEWMRQRLLEQSANSLVSAHAHITHIIGHMANSGLEVSFDSVPLDRKKSLDYIYSSYRGGNYYQSITYESKVGIQLGDIDYVTRVFFNDTSGSYPAGDGQVASNKFVYVWNEQQLGTIGAHLYSSVSPSSAYLSGALPSPKVILYDSRESKAGDSNPTVAESPHCLHGFEFMEQLATALEKDTTISGGVRGAAKNLLHYFESIYGPSRQSHYSEDQYFRDWERFARERVFNWFSSVVNRLFSLRLERSQRVGAIRPRTVLEPAKLRFDSKRSFLKSLHNFWVAFGGPSLIAPRLHGAPAESSPLHSMVSELVSRVGTVPPCAPESLRVCGSFPRKELLISLLGPEPSATNIELRCAAGAVPETSLALLVVPPRALRPMLFHDARPLPKREGLVLENANHSNSVSSLRLCRGMQGVYAARPDDPTCLSEDGRLSDAAAVHEVGLVFVLNAEEEEERWHAVSAAAVRHARRSSGLPARRLSSLRLFTQNPFQPADAPLTNHPNPLPRVPASGLGAPGQPLVVEPDGEVHSASFPSDTRKSKRGAPRMDFYFKEASDPALERASEFELRALHWRWSIVHKERARSNVLQFCALASAQRRLLLPAHVRSTLSAALHALENSAKIDEMYPLQPQRLAERLRINDESLYLHHGSASDAAVSSDLLPIDGAALRKENFRQLLNARILSDSLIVDPYVLPDIYMPLFHKLAVLAPLWAPLALPLALAVLRNLKRAVVRLGWIRGSRTPEPEARLTVEDEDALRKKIEDVESEPDAGAQSTASSSSN